MFKQSGLLTVYAGSADKSCMDLMRNVFKTEKMF